jgi:hypothetical protein
MSQLNQAKALLKEFVEASADCSIYMNNPTSKACFGQNKIVQIKLDEKGISFKIYTMNDERAKIKVSKRIALNMAEMFVIKYKFKHTHLEKDIKLG